MRRLTVALLCVMLLAALAFQGGPAGAQPPPEGTRDPVEIGKAMAANPSSVISASLGSNGTETTDETAVLGSEDEMAQFPTDGDSFAIISSGDAGKANDPNNSQSTSTGLLGLDSNRGEDEAGLNVEFAIPPGNKPPCFQLEVKFLSEEFPEYVGTAFNDFTTGRINNTSPANVTDGDQPDAPGNFLHDANNAALTVNNNYFVSPDRAGGTTYDGATPILVARTDVPEGNSFTFSVYVADVADSIFDTTVFLDNARVFRTDKCREGTFGPSVTKFSVDKKRGKILVKGTVAPPHNGDRVTVTLYRKTTGSFKKVKAVEALLKNDLTDPEVSKFNATFAQPNSGTCKVKASLSRGADYLPSSNSKTFRC